MNREFVEIEYFIVASEAQQARDMLLSHGLDAVLDGPTTNTFQTHVGSGLNGLRLFVPTDDAARAMELLASPGGEDRVWFCSECKEGVESSLDFCWSCGKLRQQVEGPGTELRGIEDPRGATSTSPKTTTSISLNPFQAPPEVIELAHCDDPNAVNHESDESMARAWNATILGIAMPVVMQLYSCHILSTIEATQLSRAGRRRFFAAWVINAITLCGLAALLVWLLFA